MKDAQVSCGNDGRRVGGVVGMNVLFMAGPGELEEPVSVPFLGERTNLDNFTAHFLVHPHSSLSIYHTSYFWELSFSWVLSVNCFYNSS